MTPAHPTRRPRVLLTGATGVWGRATLEELRRRDSVDLTVLALPTPHDRAVLDGFSDMDRLRIIWGDLTDPAAVARAVRDVDLILHVAAVVSPLADERPELARRVNIGSMVNIVRAVKDLPDPSAVAVVGVGSVAETGDRPEPVHWGRVGDPVRVSRFDEYGQTKVTAERLLVDSGLPRWAWLRQTAIFHPGLLTARDPILSHTPLASVLEWVSDRDAGRLLANIAANAPEAFWGRVHDIGGGEAWRSTTTEMYELFSRAIGVPDVLQWYERRWFALGNFHGHWFTDSDDLHGLIPFREDTPDAAIERARASLPRSVRSAGRVPPWVLRSVLRRVVHRPRGTMHAVRRGDDEKIAAYFGSREAWERIGDWSTFTPPAPDRTPRTLDHGYDETRPPSTWDAALYAGVAHFRGGELLSRDVAAGVVGEPLVWRCAFSHVFAASPRLVLHAGHWCPECVRDSAGYRRQAERSAFLAQVETPGGHGG